MISQMASSVKGVATLNILEAPPIFKGTAEGATTSLLMDPKAWRPG